METLTVSGVAKRAQVNPQTIHYYERRGLLPQAVRSPSNYRLYDEEAVRRVRFVKKAQELGFMLEEIKELLSLRAEPRNQCDAVRLRAEAKVRAVNEKIHALMRITAALEGLIEECSGRGPATPCPILAALDSEEE